MKRNPPGKLQSDPIDAFKPEGESWRQFVARHKSPGANEFDPYQPLRRLFWTSFYADYPARIMGFARQCLAAAGALEQLPAGHPDWQPLQIALFQMRSVLTGWHLSPAARAAAREIQEIVGEAVRAIDSLGERRQAAAQGKGPGGLLYPELYLPDFVSLGLPPLEFLDDEGRPVDVADALSEEDDAPGGGWSKPLPPGVTLDPRLIGLRNHLRQQFGHAMEDIRRNTQPHTPERQESIRQLERGLKQQMARLARAGARHKKELGVQTKHYAALLEEVIAAGANGPEAALPAPREEAVSPVQKPKNGKGFTPGQAGFLAGCVGKSNKDTLDCFQAKFGFRPSLRSVHKYRK